MSKRKQTHLPAGLQRRGEAIHIDIMVNGTRIRQSARTNSLKHAQEQLEIIKSEVIRSQLLGIEPRCLKKLILLSTCVKRVMADLEREGLRPKTVVRYSGVLRKFVTYCQRSLSPKVAIDAIKQKHIVAYRDFISGVERTPNGRGTGMKKYPSPRTVANELDTLRAFFMRVKNSGDITENPVVGVARPKDAYKNRVRWLNDDELSKLCEAGRSYGSWTSCRSERGAIYGHLMEFYAHTGMRLEECRHLTLDDCVYTGAANQACVHIRAKVFQLNVWLSCSQNQFDALRNGQFKEVNMRVPAELLQADWQQAVYDPEKKKACVSIEIAWRPKTDGRMIPLNNRACELIEYFKEWRQTTFMLAGNEMSDSPFLIPDETGLPWRWKMAYVMKQCSKHAGITPTVRTHDLRHTFATNLRKKGVALETLKDLLGHKDISDTLIYAHYSLEEGVDAVNRLC